METLNTDACTQMNSWLQASALHSFHCLWLGSVWDLQKKGGRGLVSPLHGSVSQKKKPRGCCNTAACSKRNKKWPFLTGKYQLVELPWDKRLYHAKKQWHTQPLWCSCWGSLSGSCQISHSVSRACISLDPFTKMWCIASDKPNTRCSLARHQEKSHFSMKGLILILSLMQAFLINAAVCGISTVSWRNVPLAVLCFCYYHHIFNFLPCSRAGAGQLP